MLKPRKVIGYFSYNISGNVFCDGDACVIAGSEASMKSYMKAMLPKISKKDKIKKTTFGEIATGLKKGAAYAIDKEAYERFLPLAKLNKINDLPEAEEFFSEQSETGIHFIRIQIS